jgi:hypothetical protein
MKIRPVGIELFHADGQTDKHMAKLTVAFRNFANAPKNKLGISRKRRFYCDPGRAKCHETSGWMQAFCAVKLPCSKTQFKNIVCNRISYSRLLFGKLISLS